LGFVWSQPRDPLLSFWVPVVGFAVSVALGVWCAINRLHDFRETARIARDKIEPEEQQAARERTIALGKATWRLLYCQIAFFGFGAVWAILALAIRN
jgi:hypothetical protein